MPLPVEKVKSQRVVTLGPEKDATVKWLREEFLKEISAAMLEENAAQAGLVPPNLVTGIRIDSGAVVPVTRAEARTLSRATDIKFKGLTRKVTFFYSDKTVLIRAFTYAWDMLQSLTPRKTGDAINTFYIWCSDPETPARSQKCSTPKCAIKWLLESTNRTAHVRILGPTVEYRRTVIYKRRGKQQTKWVNAKKALNNGPATNRYKFLAPRVTRVAKGTYSQGKGLVTRNRRRGRYIQAQVSKAIGETVKQRIKSQFKDIWVGYGFTRSREALPIVHSPTWRPDEENIHIPELYLGLKKLG